MTIFHFKVIVTQSPSRIMTIIGTEFTMYRDSIFGGDTKHD